MSVPDSVSRCVPAADLTAYAHGELPDWRRAEISRHLLRCADCRGEGEADRAVLARLRAFGADGEDWRGEVAAAGAEIAAERRARWGAAATGALAAAVLLVALAVLRPGARHDAPSPAAPPQTFASVAGTVLPADEATLLTAQSVDGCWGAGGGRRDEAATGLAVAALAARRGKALGDDTVAEAVRAGVDWLVSHVPTDERFSGRGPEAAAAGALATVGLLEVYAATGDRTLRPWLDSGLRAIENASRADLSGESALLWARRALVRAKDLGWDGVDDSIDRLTAWAGGATRSRPACSTMESDLGEPASVACRMYETAPRG